MNSNLLKLTVGNCYRPTIIAKELSNPERIIAKYIDCNQLQTFLRG